MSTRHYAARYIELAGAFIALYLWTQGGGIAAILGFTTAFGLFLRQDILWTSEKDNSERRPETETEASKRRFEKDTKLFTELLELITRNELDFLRDHGHGESFHDSQIVGLNRFVASRNHVDQEFLDPKLEDLRKECFRLAKDYVFKVAEYTFSDRDRYRKLSDHLFLTDERKWYAQEDELNSLATKVFHSLENLIREGRRRL